MTAAKKTPQQRGRRNRQRGQEHEREVCAAFAALLGTKVQRKLGQERDRGSDIHIGPLVIECKRRTSIGVIGKWLDQANADTDRSKGKFPAVVARGDKQASVVTMALEDFLSVLTQAMVRGPQLWD